MMLELELDELDYGAIHDVVLGVTGKQLTNEEIDLLIPQFPKGILATAFEWSFSDTVVKDNIHVWLQEQKEQEKLKNEQ